MSRPRLSRDFATRYQRAFQGSCEEALHHWRAFGAVLMAGITILYGYEFLYGENGWLTMKKVAAETARIEAENSDLEKQVLELKEQDRLLSSSDFVLEKLVRENLRLARPGEMIYLFEESPANAGSTGPVEFDGVTVARRPPEKKPPAEN